MNFFLYFSISGVATFLASERIDSSIEVTSNVAETTIESVKYFLQEVSKVVVDEELSI